MRVSGRQVLVDGAPLRLNGVAWSPFAVGASPHRGDAPDFAGFVDADAQLMSEAGVNVIRTYYPIRERAVLDALWRRGLHVIMTVFYDSGYGHSAATAVEHVCAVRDHPAVIMWAVTNEPNYYYAGADWIGDAREVIAAIHAADSSRPVTLPHGELPPLSTLEQLGGVDVWSANLYRGVTFGGAFGAWSALSAKPFFVAEYGADSFSAALGREDQPTHAEEVRQLASAVATASTAAGGSGAPSVLGGVYFSFADEWWKYAEGSPNVHDGVSSWTAGGGYADLQMHEEWFGLVDVRRQKKLAFAAFAQAWQSPLPPPAAPPQTCEDVAGVLAGGHTCGDRIQWLIDTYAWARGRAGQTVAAEFPSECGPCRL